jgi:hypothetical protein
LSHYDAKAAHYNVTSINEPGELSAIVA